MIETVNSMSTAGITIVILASMFGVVLIAAGVAIKKGLVAGIVALGIGCIFVFGLTKVINIEEYGKSIQKDVETTKGKIDIELGN